MVERFPDKKEVVGPIPSAPTMKIDSRDSTIKDLLNSHYLVIPGFQRPYSWTIENTEEFWNDVVVDNQGDYFIGTFVVYDDGDRLAIVDGQQRMTTLIILLCCMRDQLAKIGLKDLANGLHGLIEKKDVSNKVRYILSTETSYPYFQQMVLSRSKVDSGAIKPEERLISQTRESLTKKIASIVDGTNANTALDDKKKIQKIEEDLTKIRDQVLDLKLIKIQLDNEDDAYIIFETLNTRGKDLSVTDLVKNYIARNSKSDNKENDQSKIRWLNMTEIITNSSKNIDPSTFLHHYWLSKHTYTTIKKLFKEIKKTIAPDRKSVTNFLKEIEKDAVIYMGIFDPSSNVWTKEEKFLETSLVAFDTFHIRQQVPMILSVMRKYREKNYSLKNVVDIIGAIEKFHFIFTAVSSQRSSGGISQMYASYARRFTEAKSENNARKICNELKEKLREKIPSYDEFYANFKQIKFSNKINKQKDLIRYLLYKYNQHLNPSYSEDPNLLTIEHLSSQSSKGKNIGEIGNLLLINKTTNEKLSNNDPVAKVKTLKENKVTLDEIIEKSTTWGDKEIEDRTKYISKIAYEKIWKI